MGARPPAARVSILYCQDTASAAGQGRFSHLTNYFRPCIIYLTREPKAGWSPAAGESNLLKVAPYLTRTGALLFVSAESNNKSNDGTDHAHKREQITVCNHTHQLLSEKSGSWSIAPSVPRVSILYCQGGAPAVGQGRFLIIHRNHHRYLRTYNLWYMECLQIETVYIPRRSLSDWIPL